MRKSIVALTIALLLAGIFTMIVFAQDSTPTDDQVNAVAHQLYCPVCENTPLDVCPTEACRQWRDLIRLKLSQGWTEDQIKQYFVDNYGARVLNEPPRQGLNWIVYILPPVIILAGAIILYRSMREWTRARPAGEETSASSAVDDYVARMEEELKKRN